MGVLSRGPFSSGWTPDADAVNAPPGSLLRMDNLILDELNILSLRRGSLRINETPFEDLDIHSLHTQTLGSTRYRMAGADNHVYSNGLRLLVTMDGDGDTSFGTHMGQIFFARGSSKFKYDGTDVLNWGIRQTGGTPTVAPGVGGTTNSSELLSGDSTEAPAVIMEVDDGTGPTYVADRNGVAGGALEVHPNSGGQAIATKTWPTDQDFTVLGSSAFPATDDSVVSLWAYFEDPTKVFQISLQISVNGPTIWSDVYATIWFIADMAAAGTVVAGWNKLTVRRGDMVRGGPGTAGQTWANVRMVRLVMQGNVEDPGAVYFDNIAISGVAAGGSPLNGDYEWAYSYYRDNDSYLAYSALSPTSGFFHIDSSSAEVTIPADINRDSQVNQIWLWRRGGELDTWYRVAVYDPGTSVGTGAIIISDTTSDQDALDINITADEDTDLPPDNIIGIEGPYYDRLFVLTETHLYPSRRLSPDNYAITQIIRIAGPDERALWVKKAVGGLFIGTTKDIYRIDGTGAELPDGTTEFEKTPLSIDNPPISNGVAQEGPLMVYIASDGWRAFIGAGSQPLVGPTSFLYQGQDRHGVEAINVTEGRFRAAIAKSQLVAITPEGDDDEQSSILYRYNFKHTRWYRHPYPYTFRSIFREPDGTLIAGDNSGYIHTLDTGVEDSGSPIEVTVWTSRDDNGDRMSPKQASNLIVNADAGSQSYAVEIWTDDVPTQFQRTLTGFTSSLSPVAYDIVDLDLFKQVQLRITGHFSRFRLAGFALNYMALPIGVKAWDSGPMSLGTQDIVWARRIRMKVRASRDLTVTPYFDGIEFEAVTVSVDNSTDLVTVLEVPVPRGYFGRTPRFVVQSLEDFHPYWIELLPRLTVASSEKQPIRMAAGLGGEEAA